jgi:hypothetical protein
MDVKQGQILSINHSRHGRFKAQATRDFNTDENWYPVIVADGEMVKGWSKDWHEGDSIPCRKSLVTHLEVAA